MNFCLHKVRVLFWLDVELLDFQVLSQENVYMHGILMPDDLFTILL